MKTLLILLLIVPSLAYSAMFDMGEHTGIIKDSNGNYYRVNPAGTVSAIKTGTDLVVTEKINIPTSKGNFAVDLLRNVTADIPRMGKAVRNVAIATGPVGLTISAVQLICDLTTICNQAGQWMMGGSDPYPTLPNSYPASDGRWWGWDNVWFPDPQSACSYQRRLDTNVAVGAVFHHMEQANATQYKCYATHPNYGSTIFYASNATLNTGCASQYTLSGTECTKTGLTQAHVPTASDWDTKEALLNDARFIDTLLEKNQPLPVGTPTITTPQQVPIASETKTLKDGSGNVTGTETTTTEAVISQPSAAENPTGSPTIIKVLENSTVNNYNTSNQLTSSTTTVSSNTPPAPPQAITISIDNVPDVPLQTVAVPGTFSFTSWGSGSCPADKTWTTMFGTHQFSYQLTCDFAGMAKPIILLIAAIVSIMIVASIRTDT